MVAKQLFCVSKHVCMCVGGRGGGGYTVSGHLGLLDMLGDVVELSHIFC